jgi:hypothetical protein
MGALHNRLDRAISNNQSKNESLMSAASRISDADMAFETSRMTANQVKNAGGGCGLEPSQAALIQRASIDIKTGYVEALPAQ